MATMLPEKPDIIGKRLLFLGGSVACILLSVALLLTRGLNLGVDFAGGALLEVQFTSPVPAEELRKLLLEKTGEDVSVQQIGADGKQALLRARAKDEETKAGANPAEIYKKALDGAYPGIKYQKAEYVGPKVGEELIKGGALAMTLSLVGIMLYIWARFEWQYGVGGLLALFHDAVLTMGFFSATGLEFNLTSVAALLTIVGYSINDSVVIYDRIRENFRKFKSADPASVINGSIVQTFSRTLLTSLTTVLSLIVLTLFGGAAVSSFSYATLFGILIGTYSSIYISAPVLIYLKLRPEE